MKRKKLPIILYKKESKMKTYYFWVTLKGQAPMKVAEDGRIASEAKRIVEARFPGAKVMFAEGF